MKRKTPVGAPTNVSTGAVSLAGEIFDDNQSAFYLKITPRTLRLWRRTRGLPHYKVTSKIIRYKRADLDAWLDRSRTVIGA